MGGRINVAEASEIMVSGRPPNPVEKASLAWMPRPNSPLEKTPHKARIIKDGLMAAAFTLVAVAPKRSRPAALDGSEHFKLWPGEELSAAIQESIAGPADDVGHLPVWPPHG